jgi:uncharacterized phage infection (PIP) family protein YhgE
MSEGKTEVEFAGVKFRGGRIFAIILALSTLSGGLYGAFEFYKDYMNMRAKIESYVAPDLSGLDKQLAVLLEHQNTVEAHMEFVSKEIDLFKEEIGFIKENNDEHTVYVKDLKNGIRDDIQRVEKIMDQVEDDINDMETDVRSKIDIADQRFENKRGQLQNDYDAKADSLRTEADRKNESLRADVERALKELEARLNKRLQRALDNPLAQ